jgi:DNA-binding LacI/PurR family transcriptional regulator
VAVSDLVAMGVLAAARDRGVEVGRDVRVTGFDDSPTATLLTPPLTSVRQPVEAVARRVVHELLAAIDGQPPLEGARLVPPELIVRGAEAHLGASTRDAVRPTEGSTP